MIKCLKNLFTKPKTVTLGGVDGWIPLNYERKENE